MFALIDRQSTIDPFNESGEQPSEVIGNIELNNVDFAYPSRPGVKVLDNFSLSVPAGKVTALVVCSPLAVRISHLLQRRRLTSLLL